MNRKTYWKDVRKSFSSSKGRVVSIASLMALGSFALVGLKVTTPDMQHTGTSYFTKHQTADLTVTGSYGLKKEQFHLAYLEVFLLQPHKLRYPLVLKIVERHQWSLSERHL